MARLISLKVYRNGELIGSESFEREPGGVVKIGRLASAHLHLDDEKVSRIHAVIEVAQSGEFNVIDMGSAEGTFVNSQKINKAALKAGDEIRLGDTRLVVQGDGGDGASAGAVAETPPPAEEPTAVATPSPVPTPEMPAEVAPPAPEGYPEPVTQETVPVVSAPAAVETPVEPETRRVALPPPRHLGELPEDPHPEGQHWRLEVRHLWGDNTVLEVRTFTRDQKQVVVGEEGADFFTPADLLGSPSFTIAHISGNEAMISFLPSCTGEVTTAQGTKKLSEFGKGSFSLPPEATATVRFGQMGFRFRYTSRPAGYLSRMGERIDYTMINTVLLLLFVYAGMIATIQLRPRAIDTTEEELYKIPDRFVQFILTRPKPEKQDLTFLEKLKSDINDKQQSAPRYKGAEGKMGKPGAPDTGRRSAVKAIKPDDKEIVGNRGLLAVLGAGGPQGLSTVMGGTGLGGEMEGAIGNMFGSQVGESGGFGGLGLRGTGSGGGGMGNTIGVGGLGTRGRGGGQYGYGTGVARIRDRGERNVNISVGTPIVMGSLSMEIIRQVIASHRDQIKYCYSQELNRNPNLAGKVAVKFTISPKGYVTQASVAQTTLNNAAVENCITQKIRTWKFPEPKGGGIVIVNYPFILNPSGG